MLLSVMIAIACLAFNSGCQNNNPFDRQAVSGHVTLDGAAVKMGSIEFAPLDGAKFSSGAVINEGRYEITAIKGLPPGKYCVRIYSPRFAKAPSNASSPLDSPPSSGIQMGEFGVETIAPSFNTESKLTVEIVAGKNNSFDFDTKSK